MINQTLVVTAAQNIIRAKSSDCNNAILGNLLKLQELKDWLIFIINKRTDTYNLNLCDLGGVNSSMTLA